MPSIANDETKNNDKETTWRRKFGLSLWPLSSGETTGPPGKFIKVSYTLYISIFFGKDPSSNHPFSGGLKC